MIALIVNMGFDTIPTMDVISYFKLGNGDKVILVSPLSKDSTASMRSGYGITQIRNHISALTIAGRAIELREFAIDLDNPGIALDDITSLLKEYKQEDAEIILELSGGVRLLTTLMLMLAFFHPSLIDKISMINEISRVRVTLPVYPLTQLANNRMLMKITAFIASKGKVKRSEISEALKMSPASVSRIVVRLKSMNLIKEELRIIMLNEEYGVLRAFFANLI
jgi:CRISPR locus-related DNA-binding protein